MLLARTCCGLVHLAARCPPMPGRIDGAMAQGAIGVIRLYQRFLSPRTGRVCLFNPTCSQRAVEALAAGGFTAGIVDASRQLRRCGGAYSLSTTAQGETLLITSDGLVFRGEAVSPRVRGGGSRPAP